MLQIPANRKALVFISSSAALLLLLLLGFRSNVHHVPLSLARYAGRTGADGSEFRDVYNSTLGFQKVFVISMPHRFDRRASMSLAARLTGFDVEYVDGDRFEDDARKFLPPNPFEDEIPNGAIGAYRGHMNVLRKMIEENITSALVFEDDIDWDIRLKDQLRTFAKSSQMLLQPGQENRRWKDSDTFHPTHNSSYAPSPYGDIDKWDLLWLGHCGAFWPPDDNDAGIPLGRVEVEDDITVPEHRHIDVAFGSTAIFDEYPDHTRVVSRAWGNICSLAYGISQPGAQKFFYELGIRQLNSAADIMYGQLCGFHGGVGLGRPTQTCLTVQPQIFQHHQPVGSLAIASDIGDHKGYNDVASTPNVRWSTRINFSKLLNGAKDFIDGYKDGVYD